MVCAGVVVGDYRPTLHGIGDEALIDDTLGDPDFGAAYGCVYIAACDFPFEAHIVWRIFVNLWSAIFGGFFGVDHCGQHIVIHIHQ